MPKRSVKRDPIERLREICLALPDAHEVEAWGEPTFRVRNKIFVMYASAATHHGAGRTSVWCKAKPVTQDMMIRAEPHLYYSPPYVGPKGWVGAWLDELPDWDALNGLIVDAYRMTAPGKLVAQLDVDD